MRINNQGCRTEEAGAQFVYFNRLLDESWVSNFSQTEKNMHLRTRHKVFDIKQLRK